MHYRIKTSIQYAKTACARNVPKSEEVRMDNLKEIVHQMYVDGWRSIYTHSGKALRSPIGVCNFTLGSDSRNSLWLDLLEREVYLRSWKERHAKGVPVIMTLEEWRQCIRNIPKIENHHPARHEHSGRIDIFVEDWNDDVSDETVKFCNFRYKPEWLEKKGQTNN